MPGNKLIMLKNLTVNKLCKKHTAYILNYAHKKISIVSSNVCLSHCLKNHDTDSLSFNLSYFG